MSKEEEAKNSKNVNELNNDDSDKLPTYDEATNESLIMAQRSDIPGQSIYPQLSVNSQQSVYVQQSNTQQQTFPQQPFAQQPYPQQPYVQQPFAQKPYAPYPQQQPFPMAGTPQNYIYSSKPFNPNEPESITNVNYNICNENELTDLEKEIVMNSGNIGTSHKKVSIIGKTNLVFNNIGLCILDIRGSKISRGESKILIKGNIGKTYFIIPFFLCLIVEEEQGIGKLLDTRTCSISKEDAIRMNYPIIYMRFQNCIGNIAIIEKPSYEMCNPSSIKNDVKKYKHQKKTNRISNSYPNTNNPYPYQYQYQYQYQNQSVQNNTNYYLAPQAQKIPNSSSSPSISTTASTNNTNFAPYPPQSATTTAQISYSRSVPAQNTTTPAASNITYSATTTAAVAPYPPSPDMQKQPQQPPNGSPYSTSPNLQPQPPNGSPYPPSPNMQQQPQQPPNGSPYPPSPNMQQQQQQSLNRSPYSTSPNLQPQPPNGSPYPPSPNMQQQQQINRSSYPSQSMQQQIPPNVCPYPPSQNSPYPPQQQNYIPYQPIPNMQNGIQYQQQNVQYVVTYPYPPSSEPVVKKNKKDKKKKK